MENLLPTITHEALKGFSTYDETFKRVIPTAIATLTNMNYGIHKTFFGDGMDMNAPLSQRTNTYDLICDPKDHEAIVEAIAQEFAKVESCVKLFGIEIARPTNTRWVSFRKEKAMTFRGKTSLTITWSEDSRITTENL